MTIYDYSALWVWVWYRQIGVNLKSNIVNRGVPLVGIPFGENLKWKTRKKFGPYLKQIQRWY